MPPSPANAQDHDRPNSELEQALVRGLIGSVALGYSWWSFHTGLSATGKAPLVAAIVYMIFTGLIVISIRARPQFLPARCYFGIVLDQVGCNLLMHLGGEAATVFVFGPLWVSVGNGLRFGLRYLQFATVLAVMCTGVLSVVSAPWKQSGFVSIGLLIANIAVPAYVGLLLRRLETANAQLKEKSLALEAMAFQDGLTGLSNRIYFMDMLQQGIARSARNGKDLCLLYFDLDGFKAVNDTHGHNIGDELLKEIGLRLRRSIRPYDVLARMGGDEFALLVEGPGSTKAADRYAAMIQDEITAVSQIQGYQVCVSASIGVASYALDLGTGEPASTAIIEHADYAMYAAKRAGGGRCVFFESP